MSTAREPLTTERILTAALGLADAGGLESISMRKIAAELGVQAMSLYNHVGNKDEIVDGLVELVVGEIDLPSLGDEWKSAMMHRGNSAHTVLLRHPWAVMALMTRSNAGPETLAYVNATLGCLREAGFSYAYADRAWNAMDNHIYGFTLQEANFPFEPPDYADTAREFLPSVAAEQYPYFTALATMVMEGRYSGLHDFEFGLKLILDGLERHLGKE